MFLLASSPITSWEGAEVFYTYGAHSGMTLFWFWLSVVLCIVPLFVAWKAESKVEKDHSG